MPALLTADSVTELGANARGAVLVAGSHGGRIAAYYASRAGVHAVILNDAGIGKEESGVAGLAALEKIGMAAAAASHATARIGEGSDTLARGVVSRANAIAKACGVVPGMPVRDAALLLTRAPKPRGELSSPGEGRFRLRAAPPEIWALDSVGLALPEDAGCLLIFGSHGALHGGRADSAIPVPALAAAFHDAGAKAEDLRRLPVLAGRAIPAVTVSTASARIGEARSMWESGVLSHVNAPAGALGARAGQRLAEFFGNAFPV
ncbi:MAG: hypothetical protein OEO84_12580 [Betaproteobacteria bacterium]|nr:hypothetical protein [Betaproteobacteria bacterium]